jgi:hypothetical protein
MVVSQLPIQLGGDKDVAVVSTATWTLTLAR